MVQKTGILLCGHGSRDTNAIREFTILAEMLDERLPNHDVDHGFLEFASPIIQTGLDALRDKGNTNIFALPGMLFAAGHVKNDIPAVLNTYMAQNSDVNISYGRELGIDLKMVRAAGTRIQEALDEAPKDVSKHETLLMVVGRGASDPDANSNIAKVMRLLWEAFGFGWGEVCYSGVTFPLVEPGLECVAKLGFRRIIVFPYFLFTGILVKRIYDFTNIVADRYPNIEFIKAPYINSQELVLETFVERISEIQNGTGNMNCQMCKYREQVLGFEDEVGLPQESHHHHVEGIGTNEHQMDGQNYQHEHGRHHDHGHYPYPHSNHPLGPITMKKLEDGKG